MKRTREELVCLVQRIMHSDGTEAEIDEMVREVEENVSYTNVSDLIFYPEKEMTAEEIVDKALSYKPLGLPG